MASALNDKTNKPTEEMLKAVLTDSKPLWDDIVCHITSAYEKPGEEWKFYGTKSGWTFAMLSGKRRLINLIPQQGYFNAIFTLGEKAAAVARNADLPQEVIASIPTETQCVCGYELTLDIRTTTDIDIAKKLLAIKDKIKICLIP